MNALTDNSYYLAKEVPFAVRIEPENGSKVYVFDSPDGDDKMILGQVGMGVYHWITGVTEDKESNQMYGRLADRVGWICLGKGYTGEPYLLDELLEKIRKEYGQHVASMKESLVNQSATM